jgi:hypothetical protein
MSAILPLVGGLLLGRFVSARIAVPVQVALYLLAAVLLIVSSPRHGASHADGAVLSLVLAPLAALTLFLGMLWRRRSRRATVGA